MQARSPSAGLVAVEASEDDAGVLIPANAQTLRSHVGDSAFIQRAAWARGVLGYLCGCDSGTPANVPYDDPDTREERPR